MRRDWRTNRKKDVKREEDRYFIEVFQVPFFGGALRKKGGQNDGSTGRGPSMLPTKGALTDVTSDESQMM